MVVGKKYFSYSESVSQLVFCSGSEVRFKFLSRSDKKIGRRKISESEKNISEVDRSTPDFLEELPISGEHSALWWKIFVLKIGSKLMAVDEYVESNNFSRSFLHLLQTFQ